VCVCLSVYLCVCLSVCVSVRLYVSTLRARAWLTYSLIYGRFLFKFAVYILQITTSSKGYILFMFTHRVRARAWLNIQLTLDGFSSNLMGIYYKWQQITWDTYVLCSSTAYMRASERACVCERACADSRILSKFCGDIQQIPRGYMSYLMCVWMHILTTRTSIHSQIVQARD
jgi:hypothetical protein